MPSSTHILGQLAAMAGELGWLAIGWHVAIAAIAAALIAGWRPPARLAIALLAAPALSVAIASAASASPFNAVSFGVLAVALALIAVRGPDPAPRRRPWTIALGAALVAYGAVYPHFVDGAWYRALYAAPVGVVPCPTLAVLAGFTLIGGGLGSRAVVAALAAWTAGYALFGIARLGVVLDVGLGVAAIGLVALAAAPSERARHPSRHHRLQLG